MSRFQVASVAALVFDVFGTLVDWRSSVAAEVATRVRGVADPVAFADQWRGLYQPSMERVRSGEREWTVLDLLHRESLDSLLASRGTGADLDESERSELNRAWHRLVPWPDTRAGLDRLRRRFITATLSNGNLALLVDLARFGDLRFDAILSAELMRAYKPLPAAYLGAASLLGLEPGRVMLVAAHPDDLRAAAGVGMGTAYVSRPREYGRPDDHLEPAAGEFDLHAADLLELATQLGT